MLILQRKSKRVKPLASTDSTDWIWLSTRYILSSRNTNTRCIVGRYRHIVNTKGQSTAVCAEKVWFDSTGYALYVISMESKCKDERGCVEVAMPPRHSGGGCTFSPRVFTGHNLWPLWWSISSYSDGFCSIIAHYGERWLHNHARNDWFPLQWHYIEISAAARPE